MSGLEQEDLDSSCFVEAEIGLVRGCSVESEIFFVRRETEILIVIDRVDLSVRVRFRVS